MEQILPISERIQNIFISKLVSEEEIIQIRYQIRQIDKISITANIYIPLFNLIIESLGELITEFQCNILKLTLIFAEEGVKKPVLKVFNAFYEHMKNSGLIIKIESMLQQNIISEQELGEDKTNSDIVLNLICTYFFVMKNRKLNQNYLEICSQVIIKNITALVNIIKALNENQETIKYKNEKLDEKLEQEMNMISKVLKSLCCILEDFSGANQEYFIKHWKLPDILSPLLHLNCTTELKC